MKRQITIFMLVLIGTLFSGSLNAQYRNHMIQLPNVGYLGLGTFDRLINRSYLQQPTQGANNTLTPGQTWAAKDQLTIGTGYARAIGYNSWFDVQVAVGFGQPTFAREYHLLWSLSSSVGIRTNFADGPLRPFWSGHFHYLQIFNGESVGVRQSTQNNASSLFFGLRTGLGLEWFFLNTLRDWGADIDLYYDEMSIQLETTFAGFFDITAPPITAGVGRLSLNIYF